MLENGIEDDFMEILNLRCFYILLLEWWKLD